jgi:hypothetical protein
MSLTSALTQRPSDEVEARDHKFVENGSDNHFGVTAQPQAGALAGTSNTTGANLNAQQFAL